MKFNVSYVQADKEVLLVQGLTDVQACQYAINLHQSSNVSHEIRVRNVQDDANFCLLILKK